MISSKLQNKVIFDIQPTNPQAERHCSHWRCKYWITDVDLVKHQGNDIESPSDNPLLPEVYTATVACIYNVDRKCKRMLTPEHLNILRRGFEKAKYSGLHDNIHPPPIVLHWSSWASSHAKILLPLNIQATRYKNSF